MIDTLLKTVRGVRALRTSDLRDAIDDALSSAGYARRASGIAQALPLVGAFGAGFAVGAGVGVLFAPKSGAETRAQLRTQIDALFTKVKRGARTNGKSTIITDEHEIRGPVEPS